MSVEVLISPRISFSYDLNSIEGDGSVPIETYTHPSSSSSSSSSSAFEFAFTVDQRTGTLVRETSTADELFSDGKLLPVSIDLFNGREIVDASGNAPDSTSVSEIEVAEAESPVSESEFRREGKEEENAGAGSGDSSTSKKTIKSLKELLEESTDSEVLEEKKAPASPVRYFWRSYSLNNSFDGRKLAKMSIPSKLKLLLRSKSTGGGDGNAGSSRKVVINEEEEEEEKPAPRPEPVPVDVGASWKFSRSKSIGWENRGGLIGSLKLLLRSNSTGLVLGKTNDHSSGQKYEEAKKKKKKSIRRSTSLNCQYKIGGEGLIVDSIGSLGRSNSTGSALNSPQLGETKNKLIRKQDSTKQLHSSSSSSSSSFSTVAGSGDAKRGQEQGRKNCGGVGGGYHGNNAQRGSTNTMRVNPVLNLPSPYISRVNLDLFGFGLFCSGGKFRKKKKLN